ncbi:MAG: DUF108 domain-containing protein [Candidatus Omnitrophica bacterium]|nr:DUF108 domain-containing protein [Candidatus Omnitrophota bacterium]MDD5574843.1 DUF108 domain-containing protein [Candidatus Omnitrophota bacterium]
MKKKLKVGIIGCGAIGTSLAKIIESRFSEKFCVVAVCDAQIAKAKALLRICLRAKVLEARRLIAASDLVIEASSASVSYRFARQALSAGKSILVMSIGGILGKEKGLFAISRKTGARFLLPSGAICGLDGIRALSAVGISSLTLNTSKPPKALAGAAFFKTHKVDLSGIRKKTLIFSGYADQAVRFFPQNINVVALLQLAAGPRVKVKVQIWADPALCRNVHEIDVESKAARLKISCENTASPDNPKTSYLAILSAAASLAGFSDVVRIGS